MLGISDNLEDFEKSCTILSAEIEARRRLSFIYELRYEFAGQKFQEDIQVVLLGVCFKIDNLSGGSPSLNSSESLNCEFDRGSIETATSRIPLPASGAALVGGLAFAGGLAGWQRRRRGIWRAGQFFGLSGHLEFQCTTCQPGILRSVQSRLQKRAERDPPALRDPCPNRRSSLIFCKTCSLSVAASRRVKNKVLCPERPRIRASAGLETATCSHTPTLSRVRGGQASITRACTSLRHYRVE